MVERAGSAATAERDRADRPEPPARPERPAGPPGRAGAAPPAAQPERARRISARPVPRRLASARPSVRVPELMVGILLVAGCALAAVVWQRSASTTQQALVFARDVRRGEVLVAQDFRAADMRATGARLLPYTDSTRLVGRVVAADVSAFTPVTDDLAVEAIPLGRDESLVGRRLELGEFPLGLRSGDRVTVVVVEDDPLGASIATAAGALVPEGEPAGTGEPEAGAVAADSGVELTAIIETISSIDGGPGDVVVTLRVASPVAEQIAAAGEVRLAQVAA